MLHLFYNISSIMANYSKLSPDTCVGFSILCGYGESNPDLMLGKHLFYH